jgi:beta-lactamase class A
MPRSVLFCLALAALARAESVESLWESRMLERVRDAVARTDGIVGMAAIDLTNNRTVSFNGDAVFPQASAIKIPILLAMFAAAREGKFQLDDKVTLAAGDIVGGSGHLAEQIRKAPPLKLSVRELITAMIETSDNTATNRCIAMAGMERVNRTLDSLDLVNTRLRRVMMDADAVRRNEENVSTPLEMARLVTRLYRGELAPEQDTREMLAIMKLVKGGMRRAVPAKVEISSKTGAVPGVKCETGIIYLEHRPFALSVQSTFLKSDEPRNPVEEITGIVYAYFERVARANRYGHAFR